ncbi:MAG: glycosyltransferase, partial [Polyangiales bacterium]
GVDVAEYFGARWLVSRCDVLHVHWPESAFNHGLVSGWLTQHTLLAAMDLARARGTRCFWTAHNLAAHERRYPRQEAAAWRAFTQRLDGFVSLTEPGLAAARARFPALRDVPGFVIAHPHYRGVYPDQVSRSEARDALSLPASARVIAYVGRILDYKNVPALVHAFRACEGESHELTLVVAGQPRSAPQAAAVRGAAGADPRIHLWLRHLGSHELQLFLRAADLVVLPYREIFNSGSALLALSFDRPVLLPASPAASDLQRSCGEAWLHTYDTLTPEVLRSVLARSATLPERTQGEHLVGRDPSDIAAQTVAAYRSVLGGQRAGRTAQQPSAAERVDPVRASPWPGRRG